MNDALGGDCAIVQLNSRTVAALAAVSMVAMLSALDQTVVSTALPHIMSSLEGTTLLGWVFTGYFVGATATVAFVGKLADVFGRRRVFLVSIGLFTAASLLCGLATSMPLLVLFRAFQGVGAGAIQTCSLIVMGDMFPPRQRGRWQVINSIGYASASAIGPSVGGFLSDNVSWRWIFLVNVPLCVATMAALVYGLRDRTSDRRPRIDWPGGAWSTLLVVGVLLVLTFGGRELAWTSPEIIGLSAVSAALLLLLVRAETSTPEPVIPMSLVRGNARALSLLGSFGNSLVWFCLILLVPLRMQLVLGASATEAGALLTPGIVLGPVCSFFAGQFMARTGRYRLPSVAAGVCQLAGAAILLGLPADAERSLVLAGYLIACAGTGFGGPTFMIVYQNAIPHKQLGAGIGLLSLFRQFGASVGTALAGSMAGADLAAGVERAFVLPLAGAAAVLLAGTFTANRPLRASNADAPEEGRVRVSDRSRPARTAARP
ncbi:MAG: MFS transporter [Chloroflexi bacterium]|nr:MFS transporter [Chloroflexota bacterium]